MNAESHFLFQYWLVDHNTYERYKNALLEGNQKLASFISSWCFWCCAFLHDRTQRVRINNFISKAKKRRVSHTIRHWGPILFNMSVCDMSEVLFRELLSLITAFAFKPKLIDFSSWSKTNGPMKYCTIAYNRLKSPALLNYSIDGRELSLE